MLEFVPLEGWHLDYMGDGRPKLCEDTRGITALRDGEPEAVCVMDNWTYNTFMMHIWIGNPFVLKHGFKDLVFDYAFSDGRTKALGATPADNPKALRFNKKIGFKEIFRIKDGHKQGVDLVLQEFSRGEEITSTA